MAMARRTHQHCHALETRGKAGNGPEKAAAISVMHRAGGGARPPGWRPGAWRSPPRRHRPAWIDGRAVGRSAGHRSGGVRASPSRSCRLPLGSGKHVVPITSTPGTSQGPASLSSRCCLLPHGSYTWTDPDAEACVITYTFDNTVDRHKHRAGVHGQAGCPHRQELHGPAKDIMGTQ